MKRGSTQVATSSDLGAHLPRAGEDEPEKRPAPAMKASKRGEHPPVTLLHGVKYKYVGLAL